LSLGTGSVVLPDVGGSSSENPVFVVERERRSLKRDVQKLATSIIDDPPDAASFHTHMLLGGRLPPDPMHPVGDGPVVRMSPLVQPVWDSPTQHWVAPPGLTPDEFDALAELDTDAVKQDDVDLIAVLCRAWLNGSVLNQPIRATAGTFVVEIGHRRYAEAKAQAQAFGFLP